MNHTLRKWILSVLVCCSMSISAYAGAFQDAQTFGAAANSKALAATHGSVNANTVPGFKTANPSQTAYQNNPGAMSNAATTAATKDKTGVGKFIIHSAATRAQFNFTANDPLIKSSVNIRNHAQTLVGMNTNATSGACRNVTTTTPDLFQTYTCSTGQTSNIFSNHPCTTGRTPDIFSNHRCFIGRYPDVYKHFQCTISRPVTTSTCDRVLSVTASSRPYCYIGQTLATTRINGIAGPSTYAIGYMDFTAQCGAPGGWTNVHIRAANRLGECWGFKGAYNSRANANIPPWATGYNFVANIYHIKWSGYFYCLSPAQVYYQSHGCNGNNCSATFKVKDGGVHATGRTCGYINKRCRKWRRKGRSRTCLSWTRGTYSCTTIYTPNLPQYRTLTWTRAHNIVTYHDQWVNQSCK